MSTFVSLLMLDRCVFNSNVRAGTVAHDLPSAKGLFRDKVKFPYENLPEQLRNVRAPLNDSSDELLLNNNSNLRIATSMRSGTLNMLHVSEFGKICARFPDRAAKWSAVLSTHYAAGAMSFIESTAEGKEGRFYEMCSLAQTKLRLGAQADTHGGEVSLSAMAMRSELCRRALSNSASLRRVFRQAEGASRR